MSDEKYEIVEVSIGDIRDTDQVFGTDGKWHNITVLPIQNKCLYKVETDAGNVICSYDHYWVIYENGNKRELSTVELYGSLDQFKGCKIGTPDGASLENVTVLENGLCRCIEVKDSDDHQFLIYTDEGKEIFTRNCQTRIVCGKLDPIASQMALKNSLATTVDGSHKGAGIMSVAGVMTSIQYYFEDHSWLEKWYTDRGFDKLGYPIGEDNTIDPNDISLGEDEEEFSLKDSDQHFEFEDNSKDVINRKEQHFENI